MYRSKRTCKSFAIAGLVLASSLYGHSQTTPDTDPQATSTTRSVTAGSPSDAPSKSQTIPQPTRSDSTVNCVAGEIGSSKCVENQAAGADMRFTQTAVAAEGVRKTEATARDAAVSESLRDRPAQMQVTSPYNKIPSLNDLYTQVPTSGAEIRRFGSEAFLLGTGNANNLPSDLPVGPDYVLGPGDQLVLNMSGGLSERLNVTVDRQGQVALPEAGTIVLNGLTIAQAQAAVQTALNKQFQHETVEISLGRLRTIRVYVVGDVQRPGAYDVSALSTPLNVLYAAGGPTARGSLRVLEQTRDSQKVATIDLYDYLLRGLHRPGERLQSGDTLVVPAVGTQVTLEGAVHHPAIYELNGETNLAQVLDLAGGVLPTADLQRLQIARLVANTRRTMIDLDLPAAVPARNAELDKFKVQDHDEVSVANILPYNQQAVYLAGHVFRPGRYAYKDGMTISDLLRSYQDILPEPATRGQVVRLIAPDFRPEVIPFQLQDVLMGNTPLRLQPFDTVEVMGRYEADAPRVRIDGEVLQPGEYPLPAGMTVTQLVNLAGGLDRSAFRDIAGLTSYSIINGQSVETNHVDVNLAAALNGDKAADTLLKSGDVVSIRQITGWNDIGASITVTGEIAHPGGYGITTGEKLSSVLRRAGGFRPEAYPEAANFTREQVRALAERARQQLIQQLQTTPITVQPSVTTGSTDNQALLTSLQAQQQQLIAALRNTPASGRMVVALSTDIAKWENTPADVTLRAGDTVLIPKRPDFVLIAGQVYNPTSISFTPGHNVGWYLNKGGGPTRYGDNNRVYLLRADGSVVAHDGFGRGIRHVKVRPGDTVIVPSKLFTGNSIWRDLLASSQIFGSLALTAAVALKN